MVGAQDYRFLSGETGKEKERIRKTMEQSAGATSAYDTNAASPQTKG